MNGAPGDSPLISPFKLPHACSPEYPLAGALETGLPGGRNGQRHRGADGLLPVLYSTRTVPYSVYRYLASISDQILTSLPVALPDLPITLYILGSS